MFARSGCVFLTSGWRLLSAVGLRSAVRQMLPAFAPLGQVMALASSTMKSPTDKPHTVDSGSEIVRWTPDEDRKLKQGVKKYGKDWTKISKALLPHRGHIRCHQRWTRVLDASVKTGPWTAEEDARLTKLVGEVGVGSWFEIAKHLGGRSRDACRERWVRCIDPSLKHGKWSQEEDRLLLEGYAAHPKQWVAIGQRLPGRCDKSIRKRHKYLMDKARGAVCTPMTAAVDKSVKAAVSQHGTKGSSNIALTQASGRTNQQDKPRLEPQLSSKISAAPWSAEEDATMTTMRAEGKAWCEIFGHLPGRSKDAVRKRCKELGTGIVYSGKWWTAEEVEALHRAIHPYGSKRKNWGEIAEHVPGRTPEECRQRIKTESKLNAGYKITVQTGLRIKIPSP